MIFLVFKCQIYLFHGNEVHVLIRYHHHATNGCRKKSISLRRKPYFEIAIDIRSLVFICYTVVSCLVSGRCVIDIKNCLIVIITDLYSYIWIACCIDPHIISTHIPISKPLLNTPCIHLRRKEEEETHFTGLLENSSNQTEKRLSSWNRDVLRIMLFPNDFMYYLIFYYLSDNFFSNNIS